MGLCVHLGVIRNSVSHLQAINFNVQFCLSFDDNVFLWTYLLFFFFFEIRAHYVAQAGLTLARFSCLGLLRAEMTAMCHSSTRSDIRRKEKEKAQWPL